MRRLRCILLFLPVLLGGCSAYSLEKLRYAPPAKDPFHAALSKHYANFSAAEEQEYDWQDAWYFADKGLMAAYGNDIAPENLADWEIPAVAKAEITKARESLVAALTPELIAAHPQAAADALAAFDMWVEQQEENWQPDAIDAARQHFYDAMTRLAGQLPDYVNTTPELVVSDSYVAHFEFNRDGLDDKAQALVDRVASDLERDPNYHVVINGHSDSAGTEPYNMELSRRRAENFRQALIARGIPMERISLFAFGETDPKLPTGDNMREPINRRVEIFFNE